MSSPSLKLGQERLEDKKMDSLFGGPNRKINLLVLAPTRELAMQNQIQEKADKFGRAAGYLSAYGVGLVCLYKVRKL
jgi:superfamily II DNA/RNA helicase